VRKDKEDDVSIITVSSTSTLMSALSHAHAGDTIQLKAGEYDGLAMKNLTFSSDVTITSADPLHQAVLTNFNMTNVTGVTFRNVDLFANGPTGYYDFNVRSSTDVHFDHVTVHGSLDNNSSDDACGILFYGSNDVSITNSTFQQLGKAAQVAVGSKVVLTGNTVHDIGSDGFDFSQVDHVTVSGNNFTSFHPTAGDHADAIQFWTTGTTAPSHDIVVSNNVVTQGNGTGSQGIFIGDSNGALTFQNVTVSGNLIEGGLYNGIRLNYAQGVNISNNTLISQVNGLQIRLEIDNSTNVVSTGNQAIKIITSNDTNLTESGDTLNNVMADNGNAVLANWLHAHGEDSLYSSLKATVDASVMNALGGPLLTTSATASGQTFTSIETMDPNATSFTLTGGGAGSTVIGNALNDSITGNWAANQIFGGAGNDTIDGGGGADTLTGGAGNDVYMVLNSQAVIVEAANGGIDTVMARGDYVLPANVENLMASTTTTSWKGTGNDLNNVITGNDGTNVLDGGAGNDTISAGAGNDVLIGGAGDDRLTGGTGADTFRFAPHSGHDVITDFGAGGERDVIDISAYKAAGLTPTLHAVGSDLVISFTTGDSITLTGVHASQLVATTAGWVF
jgi:Ca2+-binding RTX toxin-like protein